jgi:hypothetical protein
MRRNARLNAAPAQRAHAVFGLQSLAHLMARKKKSRFKASTEARRQARLKACPPPAERIIPNKRDKPAKHKKPLKELFDEQ